MKNLNKYKLIKIKKISKIKKGEVKSVHDLTVSEDHSYTVNKKIVHNCLTTKQTGVGYPMASLISECYVESLKLDNPAKIIADGGMKTYSDIIKAIALGADYVMLGSILNKTLESCGDNYLYGKLKVNYNLAKKLYNLGFPIYKKFRGMSTKEVQKSWGNKILKTSEGVVKKQRVEYTLNGWIENFESYLKSAMSYSNSKTLNEFRVKSKFITITNNAYKRFDK